MAAATAKLSLDPDAILDRVVEEALQRQQMKETRNPEVLRANRMIRDFIVRKRRVCYGGLAMNNQLPPAKQFYSPLDMADFDFFTPDEGDVKALEKELRTAGFGDVYVTVGIHAGTWKVYVDYIAQADITVLSMEDYRVFYRRSVVVDGVHYTDPDTLRMMMYLELSRPEGQVDRWKKVYSRIQLLNEAYPIGSVCKSRKRWPVPADVRNTIVNYAILKGHILCSADLMESYERGVDGDVSYLNTGAGAPVIIVTDELSSDLDTIRSLLTRYGVVRVREHAERSQVPRMMEVRLGGSLVCLLVDSVACHSYVWLELADDRWVNIGSFEFMITLYLSLMIFTDLGRELFGVNGMCYVGKLMKLSHRNLVNRGSEFARFALDCQGQQKEFRTLMEEKVERLRRLTRRRGRGRGRGRGVGVTRRRGGSVERGGHGRKRGRVMVGGYW